MIVQMPGDYEPSPWPTFGRIFSKTQVQIAAASGVQTTHISKIWRHRSIPSRTTIQRLLHAFPIRAEWAEPWIQDLREIAQNTPIDPVDHTMDPDPVEESRSLACVIYTILGQSDHLSGLNQATVAVITASTAKTQMSGNDTLWASFLAARAIEHVAHVEMWNEKPGSAPPCATQRAEIKNKITADTVTADDLWESWQVLLEYAVHWAEQQSPASGPPQPPQESLLAAAAGAPDRVDTAPPPNDPAWAVLRGAWDGLDLADRARVADLAQRLARRE